MHRRRVRPRWSSGRVRHHEHRGDLYAAADVPVLRQLFDPVPIVMAFALISVILLVAYEVGFRVGRWYQRRTPGIQEGPTDMLVGSMLALLAFLLAVTMGMAADRYDARRALVIEDANAIEVAYLQAGYLPARESEATRALLREYAPLRVNVGDLVRQEDDFARSEAIHDELWAIVEPLARDQGSDVVALYVQSLSDLIELHETRVAALLYGRVPETVVLLLICGSALSLGMVGYSAGLTGHRSVLTAVVLVLALSAVLTLVLDLDRPLDGFVQVSQQPILDVVDDIGPPP